MTGSGGRARGAAFVVAAGALAGSAIWVETTSHAWSHWKVLQVSASLLSLAAAAALFQHTERGSGRRRPRGLLVAGCATWLATDVGLLVVAYRHEPDLVAAIELGHLAAQVLWAVSVIILADGILPFARSRQVADGALVGGTVAFVVLALTAGIPISTRTTGISVATLVVDGVLVTTSVLATMHALRPMRAPYVLLVGCTGVLLLTDAMHAYAGTVDAMLETWALNVGWAASNLLRAAGLFIVIRRLGRPSPAVASTRKNLSLLPACLLVVAISIAVRGESPWHPTIITTAVCLLLLIAVRELVIGLEHRAIAENADRARAELVHRAERDPLTGAFNRERLHSALADAISEARERGGRCAVLFVDLDGFKGVNDSFGHHVGDRVLVAVADRLRAGNEVSDVVCRIGGDEFVVIRPAVASDADAELLRTEIVAAVEAPIEINGLAVTIKASVGLVLADGNADPSDVVAEADRLAYGVKHDRRRRGTRPAPLKLADARSLLGRLDERRVRCGYEAVVELRMGAIVGARVTPTAVWSEGTWHDAGAALPLLRAAGRDIAVAEAVFGQACRAFGSGVLAARPWQLVVPVDPVWLAAAGFDRTVRDTLADSGLDPHRLQLEIDRVPPPGGADSLARLRSDGVSLALVDREHRGGLVNVLVELSPSALVVHAALLELAVDRTARRANRAPYETLFEALTTPPIFGVEVEASDVTTQRQLDLVRLLGCSRARGLLLAPVLDLHAVSALNTGGIVTN